MATPVRSPLLADDLTAEFLTRLPAKSVARLRFVSKRWLSIASDRSFIRSHPSFASVSGFFLRDDLGEPRHIPLDDRHDPHLPSSLSFLSLDDGDRVTFEHSCNGLVLLRLRRHRRLCLFNYRRFPIDLLYVCNPLTLDRVVVGQVPAGESKCRLSFTLAFDPSTSPDFKIVRFQHCYHYCRMSVYSSATRSWRVVSDDLYDWFAHCIFHSMGVFWNGALVWTTREGPLLAMDVEGESLRILPAPRPEGSLLYFGESGGCLHVLWAHGNAVCGPYVSQFDVLEMESDGSGWSVLHHVDISAIKDVYPEVVRPGGQTLHTSKICFLRGGNRGEARLLLGLTGDICGKLVSYHLGDKTFTTVCSNLPKRPAPRDILGNRQDVYSWDQLCPHVHTLLSLSGEGGNIKEKKLKTVQKKSVN